MHRYAITLFSIIATAWLSTTALADGSLIIKGGTFTIRRIHGDPIPVVKLYTDSNNPDLLFFEQPDGKEGFVNSNNIANLGELLGLLKSDGSEESTSKNMTIGREQDRANAEKKVSEENLKDEKQVVRANLGSQSERFGSQSQAQALLNLINNSPGKSNYQISYSTSIDTVVFGCDLGKDALVRIHQGKNGRGTGENWQGNALYRLKSASQGGSLNDTPSGKVPGIFQKF